ncbi:hypothetical protein HDU77_008824 [Chytriomyces hyalinus]|nr:hypothetical protein HDU77_008824 [Chytriomyces hyalinus]
MPNDEDGGGSICGFVPELVQKSVADQDELLSVELQVSCDDLEVLDALRAPMPLAEIGAGADNDEFMV